jgi:hypothetical protein
LVGQKCSTAWCNTASSISLSPSTPPRTPKPLHVSDALGKPSAGMVVERAVEQAVDSGADVTAMPDDAGRLLSVGGVVATLRYSSHPAP